MTTFVGGRTALIVSACLTTFGSAPQAWAQCSTPCHGPNSAGSATLDEEGNQPQQLTALTSLRYGYAGNLQGGDRELPPTGDRFGFGTLTLGADYRVFGPLVARVRMPFTWQKLRFNDGEIFNQQGPGDLELAATYDVIRSAVWLGAVGLGATIPTGRSTGRPLVGSEVPTPFQLGTGTFNPLLVGWLYHRALPSLDLHVAFEGRYVPYANGFGFQSESVYSVGTGVDYRIFDGRLIPGLDVLYIHKTRIVDQGVVLPNSGQEIIQIGWRIGYRISERWRAQLTGRFHPYQRVNLKQVCEAVGATLDLAYSAPPFG